LNTELIDIALRGATTGICFLLPALLWMSRVAREAQIAFTLLSISLVARSWTTLPDNTEISGQTLQILRLIGACGSVSVTWFVLTIFLDDRRFSWAWLVSGAVISASIPLTPYLPWVVPYLRIFAVFHFLGLLGMVLYSGLGDLQDARRRMRPAMSSFLLIYCVGLAITSSPMQDTRSVAEALGQSVALMFFLTCFALWALKANLSNWPGETMPKLASEPSAAQRSTEQTALVTRILKAMEAGVWQTEGLSVGALAQKVGAPEHQVRKAINQGLGHRNFASFINRARIDAAKERLGTGGAAETTILEIAYDVGFASLGPFNRAFREATGLSPTDFRKQSLQQSGVGS